MFDTNYQTPAKDFIKKLLNPDPKKRPTAAEAYADHWLTTHIPSTEHDLSEGLRENFDARAQWRAAIASARVLARLNRVGSASRQSTSSGGWKNEGGNDGNETDESDEGGRQSGKVLGSPESEVNRFVNVIPPPGDSVGHPETQPPPHEAEAASSTSAAGPMAIPQRSTVAPSSSSTPPTTSSTPKMPGHFCGTSNSRSNVQEDQTDGIEPSRTWEDMFKKMGLR
jgi:calcium/calmodulin-dependent protein kinase I